MIQLLKTLIFIARSIGHYTKMFFHNCPVCNKDWQYNGLYCVNCEVTHFIYINKNAECIHRRLGGTKYIIYWYADDLCLVLQNWSDGTHEYEKCVSKKIKFPFDITLERLEELLILL